MAKPIPPEWGLDWDQMKQIYDVETELASQLKHADPSKRKKMYSPVYEEYFRKLPFHPQITIKKNPELQRNRVSFQLRQILPFSNSKKTLMEIGAGDGSLSVAASNYFDTVYALEVAAEMIGNVDFPKNVKSILFDGFDIPLGNETIDVAYSNQLMEHLHPDDAEDQLKSIYRVLKKKGVYICITPNRISGPSDISWWFTDIPVGFHLKEYSAVDLKKIFKLAGFSKVIGYTIIKGKRIDIPFPAIRVIETIAEWLPAHLRNSFVRLTPVSIVFNSIIVAIK